MSVLRTSAGQGITGEFCRFFVVGVGATLLHLMAYWGLNALLGVDGSRPFALSCTYTLGYAISFIANYFVSLRWTFKTSGSVAKGVGFAFSHAVNAGLHVALLNLFRVAGAGAWLAWMVQAACPALIVYFPFVGKPETLLPIPVYFIVVPTNFLMVRFFLCDRQKQLSDG
ncbi:MAG: hypothetical protein IJB89_01775 [Akkermansia sp.]|nr:hypothetical protein [Akkermansiaceae bacterium]MBQ3143224.1 hypothetical protein [Akkermansia sp.]